MWSFQALLCNFFISAFVASRIVRALIPWFWLHTVSQTGIIAKVETIPEIDNAVYGSWIVLFVLLFLALFFVSRSLTKRYRWFNSVTEMINLTVSVYLLITPVTYVFALDQIRMSYFILSILAVIIVYAVRLDRRRSIDMVISAAILRYAAKPLVTYDIAPNHYPLLFDYVFIAAAVITAGYGYLIYWISPKFRYFIRGLYAYFPVRRIAVILTIGMMLSILHLITQGVNQLDMYFTWIPVYQLFHGATPLVSMMSQYGLLYLTPWIVWLALLPKTPITYQAGAVVTATCLIGYFVILFHICAELFHNRLVYVSTMLSAYYFTILVVSYGFLDRISVVLTPAFTPLRFGVFLFPFILLIAFCRRGEQRFFRWFLVMSALFFFFSFEIGAGILSVGIVVGIIEALTHKRQAVRTMVSHGKVLIGTLFLSFGAISAFIYLRSGKLPDWTAYTYFSRAFGSGYLMLPIGRETAVIVPIGIALFGGIFGLWQIMVGKEKRGYLWVYLSAIILVELPYYMGRSVFQTLYDISLPYVLFCGLIAQYGLSLFRTQKGHVRVWIMMGICGFVIFIGGFRGFFIVGDTTLHAAEVVEAAAIYTKNALTQWDIKTTPAYAFLHKNLPAGCPLILFDADERQLLPALDVPAAFNFEMVWGYIISREQVDTLIPYPGAKRICVFVNGNFIAIKDDLVDGVYRYFWKKYGASARLVAEDQIQQFSLYEIPATNGKLR